MRVNVHPVHSVLKMVLDTPGLFNVMNGLVIFVSHLLKLSMLMLELVLSKTVTVIFLRNLVV